MPNVKRVKAKKGVLKNTVEEPQKVQRKRTRKWSLYLTIFQVIVAIVLMMFLAIAVVKTYEPESLFSLVRDGFVQNVFWVFSGVLLFEWLQGLWLELRWGRWQVIIKHPTEAIPPDDVTAIKAKNVLNEPSEKRVWIKGLMSTYVHVQCDCIGTLSEQTGLFKEDKRKFVIDFSKLETEDGKVLASWLTREQIPIR